MTPKKSDQTAGSRPDLTEAIYAWDEVARQLADSPLTARSALTPSLHSHAIVEKAILRLSARGYNVNQSRSLLHYMAGRKKLGRVDGFILLSHALARLLWGALSQEIERQIRTAEPYR